ncbi:hypothetical protein [Pontibacter fetidus]|uniref:Uncharacterized protein n=1 Tax=Pontibacter fetidus TaxID=2700082 RepID=A0A6B2H797_9BACT|nr:hypothetical protein [Pontibacter fetidus]NDK56776.1 hypothetical protein [Pontibacter fetidus]
MPPTIDPTFKQPAPIANLPAPILFHPLKHHLGYIKNFIEEQVTGTASAVGTALQSIGTSQLDFYIGALSPVQIACEVILNLQHHNLLEAELYHAYLTRTGSHYRTINLSDNTDWVLRWGTQPGRYVHLHPARYAAQTIRVKATSLKTAIAAIIAARREAKPVTDLGLINKVRGAWLQLPPLTIVTPTEGAGKMLELLKRE